MKGRVLIIEDERVALQALSLLLSDENYEVLQADRGERGLVLARQEQPDLILLDIRLPDCNGLQVLEQFRREGIDSAVIVMTADTTSSNAIQATQLGAFDYIAKPINDEHLLVLIRRALEYRSLERELQTLRSTPQPQSLSAFVGHSVVMQEVYKLIGRVAPSDANVLVFGESGTGKELVADSIHKFSRRVARSDCKSELCCDSGIAP